MSRTRHDQPSCLQLCRFVERSVLRTLSSAKRSVLWVGTFHIGFVSECWNVEHRTEKTVGSTLFHLVSLCLCIHRTISHDAGSPSHFSRRQSLLRCLVVRSQCRCAQSHCLRHGGTDESDGVRCVCAHFCRLCRCSVSWCWACSAACVRIRKVSAAMLSSGSLPSWKLRNC